MTENTVTQEEAEVKIQVQVAAPAALWRRAKSVAALRGMTNQQLLAEALELFVAAGAEIKTA